MTKIQRVYGKGRFDGIVLTIVTAALIGLLYIILKPDNRAQEPVSC